jgi:hypothetical protein
MKNKYFIVFGEAKTGIILNNKREYHHGSLKEAMVKEFAEFSNATIFCKQKIEKEPHLECLIFNSKEELIETLRNEHYLKSLNSRKRRKWWHFFTIIKKAKE